MLIEFRSHRQFGVLYQADFRLRAFITAQLEAIASSATQTFKHTSTTKAAEQLALCCKIGFGVAEREGGKESISIDRPQNGAIENQMRSTIESEPLLFEPEGFFEELFYQGFVAFVDFPSYYRGEGLTHRAKDVHRREIQDTREVFWGASLDKSYV